MKDLVTSILTDQSTRTSAGAEQVLLNQASEANPWLNVV